MTLMCKKIHNNIVCPLSVVAMLNDVGNKFIGRLLDERLYFNCIIVELAGKMSGVSTVTNLCKTVLSVIALIGISIVLCVVEVRVSAMIDASEVAEIGFVSGTRVDFSASMDANISAAVKMLDSIPTRA